MPTIAIDNFGGIAPRIHPTLLGATMATRAHNCLLKSGKLVPIRQPLAADDIPVRLERPLTDVGDAQTLYVWNRADGSAEILAWKGIVYVTPSNLSHDKYSRLFVSGETGVNGNHPCAYIYDADNKIVRRHDLVKEVLDAPEASLEGDAPSSDSDIRYTAFVQTWVDDLGYESGASMPSAEIEYSDGDGVVIGYVAAPTGAKSRRIYKVVAGSEGENFQFVYEQQAVAGAFQNVVIAVRDEDAGEVLPTLQGPAEDLEMIIRVPNGFYAGVNRSDLREVRFSESGNPTQWPDAYTASVHDDIVGIAATLNTVFVMTKGMPWAITGTSPDAMTAAILASPQGCVSARSICVFNGNVFYASADGICMLTDGAATVAIITDKMFSRRDWQALKPESCKMLVHDSTIFCWFLDPSVNVSLAISLTDDSTASITTHDELASAVCVDLERDQMRFVGRIAE